MKGYRFLPFAKYMVKNIGTNLNKNLSGKYSQTILDHAKQSGTDTLKTAFKRAIQKTAKATVNLISSKVSDRITKVLKVSQQNNSETVTNEYNKKIPKKRYISSKERQKIVDDLKLI